MFYFDSALAAVEVQNGTNVCGICACPLASSHSPLTSGTSAMTSGMAAWYDNEVEEYSSETLLNDDMVAGGQ